MKQDGYRIARKEAQPMEEIIREYIRSMKLSAGVHIRCIYSAWDAVSGAAAHTLDKFYKAGTLYVTVSSSVVRDQLYFQRDTLLKMLREALAQDPLYEEDPQALKAIVLK